MEKHRKNFRQPLACGLEGFEQEDLKSDLDCSIQSMLRHKQRYYSGWHFYFKGFWRRKACFTFQRGAFSHTHAQMQKQVKTHAELSQHEWYRATKEICDRKRNLKLIKYHFCTASTQNCIYPMKI